MSASSATAGAALPGGQQLLHLSSLAQPPRFASEALDQEIEKRADLRDLLRARWKYGKGGRPFRVMLVEEQRHQLARADRPGSHVVAEPGDAGTLQRQLQDAFQAVAGKGGDHMS